MGLWPQEERLLPPSSLSSALVEISPGSGCLMEQPFTRVRAAPRAYIDQWAEPDARHAERQEEVTAASPFFELIYEIVGK